MAALFNLKICINSEYILLYYLDIQYTFNQKKGVVFYG